MENQTRIAVFIVLGCCVMFLLVLAIIVFVVRYQRKIMQREIRLKEMENEHQLKVFTAAITAEENQKQTISSNLHDTINPNLSLAQQYVRSLRLDNANGDFHEKLVHCEKLIQSSLEGIRDACYDLVPKTLFHLGLFKAIEHLVFDIKNSSIPDANYRLVAPENIPRLDPKLVGLPVLRITQELLNNVVKHSDASWLDVVINIDNQLFTLEISHDGRGLKQSDIEEMGEQGLGLRSMQSRALLLKGSLVYMKGANGENRSKLTVPIGQVNF